MKKILLLFVLSFSMTAVFAQLEGTTWKLAPQAGALGVGPTQGDVSWWANSLADVTTRDCLFDDQFIFNADGSFMNVQDGMTWIEAWQGGADACAAPVAPHDGSNPATWSYDGSTITLNGVGAHLGLAKVTNGGELTSPGDAPASITYMAALSGDGNTMTVDINFGGGFWRFILEKEGIPVVDPVIEGVWKLDPQAGALAVGPTQGDGSWWSSSAADVMTRACLFDDKFVFGTDGSFRNIQAGMTWVETWQGAAAEGCDVPVAPHDGSNAATFAFDAMAGTLTLNGVGAHLGLAKVTNGGELTSPGDAPASVSYLVSFSPDAQTMTVDINFGAGFWRFVMLKDSGPCSAPTNIRQTPGYPASCHVMWDPVPGASRYDIFYRVNGTSVWSRTGALSNSKTLHNLDPTAVYQYRVRTNCGDGWDFANASKFHYFNMNNAPQPRENVVGITGITPNPARDILNVGITAETISDVNLSIVDMMGKIVYQKTINNVEGLQNETVDVSTLAQGYYMLVIQSGDKRIVEKFATIR